MAKSVFEEFDVDKNGEMDAGELATFMVNLSKALEVPPPTIEEINQVIVSLD